MVDMSGKGNAPRPETAAALREAARSASARREGPTRRRFTSEYKRRILRELDELRGSSDPGAMAAMLRREGLGRSLITRWRRQRDAAEESALSPRKRGRKPLHDSLVDELKQARRQNEALKKRLAKAEIIIDIQKKLSVLLGVAMPDPSDDEEKP